MIYIEIHCSASIQTNLLYLCPSLHCTRTHSVRLACLPSETSSQQSLTHGGRTQLTSLRGSDLLSHHPNAASASKELARIFSSAAEYAGKDKDNVAVIFMDECDALFSSDACAAMLGFLLDRMDGIPPAAAASKTASTDHLGEYGWFKIIVVAATNRIDAVPEFLRRPGRFDREICISPPDANERAIILSSLVESCYDVEVDVDISERDIASIAEACVGYVAADLSALVRRAAILSLEEYGSKEFNASARQILSYDHFLRAMADVGASALRDAALSAPPKTTWDDVAGDAGGAKTALRRAIEWPRTMREDFIRLGIVPPRGILLFGPPGCAKTSLAKAAAGSAGVAFLSLSPADVYASSYVGEAEAIVRRAFSLARSAAPCVLFFDEIDSILGSDDADGSGHGMGRGGRGSSAEARVLSTFLNEMDGVDVKADDGVLVLGATNRPSTLDAALLRPGRFDKAIFVPPPDKAGRKAILQQQCQKWEEAQAVSSDEDSARRIDIDYLASDEVTGRMTGAEVVGACREAAMLAIRETLGEHGATKPGGGRTSIPRVTQEHIVTALSGITPLLADESLELVYAKFEDEANRLSK